MNPRLRSEGATWWTQGSLFQNGGEPRFASGRGARNFSWLRAGAITKKQHGGLKNNTNPQNRRNYGEGKTSLEGVRRRNLRHITGLHPGTRHSPLEKGG